MIFVFADHREARVGGVDNHVRALFQRLVALERHHLGARDHDVAHALLGDIHHAFQHVAGIGIDQVVLFGITDQLDQIATVLGSPWNSWLRIRVKNPFLGLGLSLLCEWSSLMAFSLLSLMSELRGVSGSPAWGL